MSVTVAVGMFDGLHRGHLALFERSLARAQSGRCVAISFDPHPDVVLAKEFRALAPLTPLPEKHAFLARRGIELHVVPFTRELAALTPEEFVEVHLRAPFAPDWLVVGEDFALGRGRSGNVERLRSIGQEAGFEVESVPLLSLHGSAVTSTRIREALSLGQVAQAAELLGRRYRLLGTVVHGDKIGRTLGYPTANLRLHDEKLVPAHGIYAVWSRLAGEARWRPAAMSVGVRPTFGGVVRTLEVHLLDWEGDLYGQDVEVAFVDHLRPELRFDSREALIEAMAQDIIHTRQRLTAAAPEPPGDA